MSYIIVQNDEEIDDTLNRCLEAEDEGSIFPGMTYEQGARYAIEWLIGLNTEHPLDE